MSTPDLLPVVIYQLAVIMEMNETIAATRDRLIKLTEAMVNQRKEIKQLQIDLGILKIDTFTRRKD